MSRIATAALLGALAAGPVAAGTVTVTSTEPARFADIGLTAWEREANVAALSRHLESLGARHLGSGRTLKVELLDIDLAGTLHPAAAAGRDLRVVLGRADVPRIRLRYALEGAGAAPRSGEEWLSDLNYISGERRRPFDDPLRYEKRMLERWFRERIVEGAPAPK